MSSELDDNVKTDILKNLAELSEGVDIVWDRVVYNDEEPPYINIYGWIVGSKPRDFVLCRFDSFSTSFVTSSVKYSKTFARNWGIPSALHRDCILFKDFFGTLINNNGFKTVEKE